MNLLLREVSILNCVSEDFFSGAKANWIRTEHTTYKDIKESLREFGLINPLWLMEIGPDKYKVAKGLCRIVCLYDLDIHLAKALIAPIGMSKGEANKLFFESDFKDTFTVDHKPIEKGF